MSIRKSRSEIKFSLESFMLITVGAVIGIIGTSTAGYYIGKAQGYLSALSVASPSITYTEHIPEITTSFTAFLQQPRGLYFASKNGSRFYPLGCKTGDRVSPENRVWFQNEIEAVEAGYTPSVQC